MADAAGAPGEARAPGSWEAERMLDVYVLDYLRKRRLLQSAALFQSEAKLAEAPVAIDTPRGFLFEWWAIFWDVFIARSNDKSSDAGVRAAH